MSDFIEITFRVNRNCGATFLVNIHGTETRKEDDGFDGAFLSL